MKTIILAGGKGTRISEESAVRPKPMVNIGNRPIMWHIMKIYASHGYNEFIICCGYKGEYIKKYFAEYNLQNPSTFFTLDKTSENGKVLYESECDKTEDWKIICANTGLETLTAGRIKAVREYLGDDTEFMITYGDGVGDIDISALIDFHRSHDKIITISTTRPEGRFGAISIADDGQVISFQEKARKDQSYINIGFMVADTRLFDYLGDGTEMLERGPFEKLAEDGQMMAYKHPGFWSPMDNIHDRDYLERLWNENAPWRRW